MPLLYTYLKSCHYIFSYIRNIPLYTPLMHWTKNLYQIILVSFLCLLPSILFISAAMDPPSLCLPSHCKPAPPYQASEHWIPHRGRWLSRSLGYGWAPTPGPLVPRRRPLHRVEPWYRLDPALDATFITSSWGLKNHAGVKVKGVSLAEVHQRKMGRKKSSCPT